MKKLLLLALFLVLGPALAGCAGGNTIVTYERGTPAFMGVAPEEDTYVLRVEDESRPRYRVKLHAGAPLGFRETIPGQIVAVAGTQQIPLQGNKTYYWEKD